MGKKKTNPLAGAQSAWEQSEARSFGTPLPDGEYVGVIEQALIETSRAGRLQVRWDLQVTDGKSAGRQCRKYNGLVTKENMDWFKGDLETLELEVPEDIADLGETLEAAAGMAVAFQVRSKDEYTNIDFIEPLEAVEEEEEEGEEEEEEEEETEEVTEETTTGLTKKQIDAMDAETLLTTLDEAGYDVEDFEDDEDYMRETLYTENEITIEA